MRSDNRIVSPLSAHRKGSLFTQHCRNWRGGPAQFSWPGFMQYAVFLLRPLKAPINGPLALYNGITKQRSARHARRAWRSAVCLKPQFSWKVVMILCREPTESPAEPTAAFCFVNCRPKIRLQETPHPWRPNPPRSLLFSMPSAAEK